MDQQHNQGDADDRYQEGHKGAQPQKHLTGSVFDVEVGKGGEAFEHIRTVGNGAESLPLENGPEDFRKAQGGNGKIVALQPKHRGADEGGKQGSHQAGAEDAHQHGADQA